jgi:hypothetical protein
MIALIFTVSAILRVWHGVQLLDFLGQLSLSVSPLYLIITGGIWAIAGGWTTVWVWLGHRRAPVSVIILALIYLTIFWAEQFFLMINPLRRVNWLFLGGLSVVVLLVIFLSFRHPQVRNFYGGSHE